MELNKLVNSVCPQVSLNNNWNWFLNSLQKSANYSIFDNLVEDYSKESVRVGIVKSDDTKVIYINELPIKGISLYVSGTTSTESYNLDYFCTLNIDGVKPFNTRMELTMLKWSSGEFFAWKGEPTPSGAEEPLWEEETNVEWDSNSLDFSGTTVYGTISSLSKGINAFIIDDDIRLGGSTDYYKSKYLAYFHVDPASCPEEELQYLACSKFIDWISEWQDRAKSDGKVYTLVYVGYNNRYFNDELRMKFTELKSPIIGDGESRNPLATYHLTKPSEGVCHILATKLSNRVLPGQAFEIVTKNYSDTDYFNIPIIDGRIINRPLHPILQSVSYRYSGLINGKIPEAAYLSKPNLPSNEVVQLDNLNYSINGATVTKWGRPFMMSLDGEIISERIDFKTKLDSEDKVYYGVSSTMVAPEFYYEKRSAAILAATSRCKVLWKLEKVRLSSGELKILAHVINTFEIDSTYKLSSGHYSLNEEGSTEEFLVQEGSRAKFCTVYYDVFLRKLDWSPNGFIGRFHEVFKSVPFAITSRRSLFEIGDMFGVKYTEINLNARGNKFNYYFRDLWVVNEQVNGTMVLLLKGHNLRPGDLIGFDHGGYLLITGVVGDLASYVVEETSPEVRELVALTTPTNIAKEHQVFLHREINEATTSLPVHKITLSVEHKTEEVQEFEDLITKSLDFVQ